MRPQNPERVVGPARLQYPLRQPNGVAQYKGCQAHPRPLFHQIKLQRLLQSHRNPTNKAAPHLRRHRVGTRNPLLYHPTLRNIHTQPLRRLTASEIGRAVQWMARSKSFSWMSDLYRFVFGAFPEDAGQRNLIINA